MYKPKDGKLGDIKKKRRRENARSQFLNLLSFPQDTVPTDLIDVFIRVALLPLQYSKT